VGAQSKRGVALSEGSLRVSIYREVYRQSPNLQAKGVELNGPKPLQE
jgi:hypothetical protein